MHCRTWGLWQVRFLAQHQILVRAIKHNYYKTVMRQGGLELVFLCPKGGVKGQLDVQEGWSHRSQCMGDPVMCRSQTCAAPTGRSLSRAQLAGSGYGAPCWTRLEAQLLGASEDKNCSCKQSRWDDLAGRVPMGVGDRQWTPSGIPHKSWGTSGGGPVFLWHASSRSAPPVWNPLPSEFL